MFTLPYVRVTHLLCCVHIAQLITHPVGYTSPFTLELCYKPFDIFQRVTKSQKVHFLSPNGLQNFITSTSVNIGPNSSLRGDKVTGTYPSLTKS